MKAQIKKAEEKMQKSIHVLTSDFAAIRAGRANPASRIVAMSFCEPRS